MTNDRPEDTVVERHSKVAQVWLGLLIIYWVALLSGTHIPRDIPGLDGGVNDKFAHFSAYAILALLLAIYRYHRGMPRQWSRYAPWILLLLCGGMLDEITQPAVGRTADLLDWIADMLGVFSGFALFHYSE